LGILFHSQGRKGRKQAKEGGREEGRRLVDFKLVQFLSPDFLVRDRTTKVARVFQFHEWGKIQNLGPPPGSSLALLLQEKK
jgi:hypothetical protein